MKILKELIPKPFKFVDEIIDYTQEKSQLRH